MTLDEIRQKYPYYKNVPDQQLADALYKKHYSHAPREEFNKRIGYQPKKIDYQDFLQQGLKDYESGYQRIRKNVMAGGLEGLRGVGNVPYQLNLPNAPYFEPTDFGSMVGLEGEPGLADKLIQGLAQFAPSMALPGANIGKLGQAIGSIPKAGKFLQGAVEQAIPQAAYGATQNEKPITGAIESGLGSLVGSGLGKALESGINAFRPTKIYKSPLSEKELQRSLEQAEGTSMDLGNVIENPRLQRLYENKLPKLTGEASSKMQETGQQIVQKGEQLMSKLLGSNSPENIPSQLTSELTKQFIEHQKFKNNLYNEVDDLAKTENLKLDLSDFSNKAKDYIGAIEDTTLLKHEPDARKILNKLMNYKEPVKETKNIGLLVNKQGEPLTNETIRQYPTLKEANILKGKLSNYSNIYLQSSSGADRNLGRIFRDLAKSLKGDIQKSIESHGSSGLKQSYKQAEENYSKNFSPFLDKDVYKFVSGNADPETLISKFITRSTSSDLGGKLSKLAEKLSKSPGTQGSEGSNLLAYGYLSRALDNEGTFNPSKFATAVKQLGARQLKALFPDKAIRNEVLNYKALVNKNPRALNVMFNPLTGQVNADLHPNTLAQIVGGLSGLMAGGAPGAIIGAAAAPIVKSKLAKYATKKLTDPVYRKKFVDALIKNQGKEMTKTKNVIQKGSAIAAGLSGKDEEQRPMELLLTGGRKK